MRAIMEQSIQAKNRDTVLNDENAEDGNCRMNIQKEVLKCRTRQRERKKNGQIRKNSKIQRTKRSDTAHKEFKAGRNEYQAMRDTKESSRRI